MTKLRITTTSAALIPLLEALAACGECPETAAALEQSAAALAQSWKAFAQGYPLAGVKPLKRGNGKYVEGVKVKRTGALEYEIYNDSAEAERVARGRPALDMKKTHPFGPRSRISKTGNPYLIVPIQWGTPPKKGEQRVGFKYVMPRAVYAHAKKLMPTKITVSAGDPANTRRSPNYRGESVGRAQYRWGGRLNGADFKGTAEEQRYLHGMTRMAGKGGYFTFRVISAVKPQGWDQRPHKQSWEESWVKPAEPARDVVSALAAAHQPGIEEGIRASIRRDLYALLSE